MSSDIKSARRVLAIMEAFEDSRRPMGLKEICGKLGFPVSSTCGLLKMLVVMGYLDFDRFSLTYLPTMRIAGIGGWIPGALFGDGGLQNALADLHGATGHTVVLGAQSDLYAQYIHVMASREPGRVQLKPGTIRPLARSGVGLALLSIRTDCVIDGLVRGINVQERATGVRLRITDVLRQVREVRDSGYAFSRSTCVPDHGMLAMVLPFCRNDRHLALGVGGPVAALDAQHDRIVTALARCAAAMQDSGEGSAKLLSPTWPVAAGPYAPRYITAR